MRERRFLVPDLAAGPEAIICGDEAHHLLHVLRLRPGDEVVVFEDSLNGVIAAKSAGMFVVVVPNPVTAHTDLSSADLVLESLTQTSVEDLTASLEKTAQH